LRNSEKIGFNPPPDHPDITPAHEALQLSEQFRELARTTEIKKRDAKFLQVLQESEEASLKLHQTLSAKKTGRSAEVIQQSSRLMQQLGNSCKKCHAAFRDVAQPKNN
jgi:hypothetical protein